MHYLECRERNAGLFSEFT